MLQKGRRQLVLYTFTAVEMKKLVFVTILVLAMLSSPGHPVSLAQGASPPEFNPYGNPPGYTPPSLSQGSQVDKDTMMMFMMIMMMGKKDCPKCPKPKGE